VAALFLGVFSLDSGAMFSAKKFDTWKSNKTSQQ
jgi:hypothetical protein